MIIGGWGSVGGEGEFFYFLPFIRVDFFLFAHWFLFRDQSHGSILTHRSVTCSGILYPCKIHTTSPLASCRFLQAISSAEFIVSYDMITWKLRFGMETSEGASNGQYNWAKG